jgi:hypothetical protein
LDQRGTERAFVSAPDIGAFQAQPAVAFRLSAPSPVTAGSPFSLTVVALDAWDNTASTYLGKVHFVSTDPAAQLPADYQFLAVDGGTRTLTATLWTPGVQEITVHDVTNVNRKGTVAVNVLPSSRIGVIQPPTIPRGTVVHVLPTARLFRLRSSDPSALGIVPNTVAVPMTPSDEPFPRGAYAPIEC